jgi:nucleotide-binding universal stress UspA family protein
MARESAFRVLVATDGSRHAQAAITTAIQFPWPDGSRVRAVIARNPRAEHRQSILLAALDRSAENAAERARSALSRRWQDVEVAIIDKVPVNAILTEAKQFRADVIVLGWRGHGGVRRLLMGSVSRGVVRGATSAVLVVRQSKRVSRIVFGYDESRMAKRALEFINRLAPPQDARVTLMNALQLMPVPSRGRVPGAGTIASEIRRRNTQKSRAAMRELTRVARRLKRNGWHTRTTLTSGEPLHELLRAVATARAQLLVVGARGTTGVRQLLLGSVAEGSLNRSPVPVLLVR